MHNAEIQCKDDYDEFLGFSRITGENWLLPDRKDYMPFGVMKDEWTAPFLEPRLGTRVPRDVIRLLEIVRGCMIYSWFFFPLATLGLEQCTRIAEFAVWERCRVLQCEPGNFFANIDTLVKAGIISLNDEPRWQALRNLRNDRSHPKGHMLIDPGQAVNYFKATVELVNALFASSAPASPT